MYGKRKDLGSVTHGSVSRFVRQAPAFVAVLALAATVHAAETGAADTPVPIDYLTLANGAIPVAVGGEGATLGASFEQAIRIVDGNPSGFSLTRKPGPASLSTEFLYELPAPTTFDRFAVPGVLETPSPSTTFVREVRIEGSSTGPDSGFVTLARTSLQTHTSRGEYREIVPAVQVPVRWVKLVLGGGISVLQPNSFFEFSEIIGNGRQEVPDLLDRFNGSWKGRGVKVSLEQAGAVVSGCYDADGTLEGTVSGNLLRALGVARSTGVQSSFILSVRAGGALFGVRSSNGAPFAMYTGDAGQGEACTEPLTPELGCGAVIHGINFDFDSAAIRADSGTVLDALFAGLAKEPAQAIVIEGHTSSEGGEVYNQNLSERRAQAVVQNLVARGIAATRLSAAGVGEKRPIASNDDENGRSLNRRVEVQCK